MAGIDFGRKIVGCMIVVDLRHRQATAQDIRSATDQEGPEVAENIAAAADHIHQVQAIDIRRLVAFADSLVAVH